MSEAYLLPENDAPDRDISAKKHHWMKEGSTIEPKLASAVFGHDNV
jgi:hypothetical protein